MVELAYPPIAKHRGYLFWLNPANLWASRRVAKADYSNEWRHAFEAGHPPPVSRSASFATLLGTPATPASFKFIIVGDTGEGDRSQYGLLPLMRAARPDFMVVNGDVAYPAGRYEDFVAGFFQPYRNFDIPIWGTPGNHEYYSEHNGREFYDLFCSYKGSELWSSHGLQLVPQPGMYWELSDPEGRAKLVVIGIDSGKKANLDGHTGLWSKINPFDHDKHPDTEQHEWLEWRLGLADARGDAVMVLYHIPALVSRRHDGDTHLGALHRMLARHPSVRAVICGHIHNYQRYAPATFAEYCARQHGAQRAGHGPPYYIVSGNGGATLDGTLFKHDDYPVEDDVFPSEQQWKDYVGRAQRLVDAVGFGKSLLSRTLGLFKETAAKDADAAQFLSFLLVEVNGPTTNVSVVRMEDLEALFSRQPNGTRINVDDAVALLDPDALARCTTHLFDL